MNIYSGLPERFRVDETLSRRTLSCAFRATDLETGSTLVLKALRYPIWFSPLERLRHQKRLARSLDAVAESGPPECLALRPVGESEHSLIYARDWVEGRPLSESLSEGQRLETWEAARIARECSEPLDRLADAGIRHGGLTADNLILRHDASLVITDPCFASEAACFDVASARCDLRSSGPGRSDVAALAEILLERIQRSGQDGWDDGAAARVVATLDRARKNPKAFARVSSLADALTSLTTVQIARRVWRPATATGLLGALATVGTLALSDEKPATNRNPLSREGSASSVSAVQQPAGPKLDSFAAEERSEMSLEIRRQGIAALLRPSISQSFQLTPGQIAGISTHLIRQRDRIASMVENAIAGKARVSTALPTRSLRQSTTDDVLATLTPAQRELWLELAEQEPAYGEPLL